MRWILAGLVVVLALAIAYAGDGAARAGGGDSGGGVDVAAETLNGTMRRLIVVNLMTKRVVGWYSKVNRYELAGDLLLVYEDDKLVATLRFGDVPFSVQFTTQTLAEDVYDDEKIERAMPLGRAP